MNFNKERKRERKKLYGGYVDKPRFLLTTRIIVENSKFIREEN